MIIQMDVNARMIHSFFARCLYTFLLDGTMKAYGVILEATVASYHTSHALIGPIFTLQLSVSFFVVPVVGLVEDLLGPRLAAILGGALITTGFIGRALLPHLSLWYLLLFTAISGVGFGLVNFVTYIGLKNAYGNEFPAIITLTAFAGYSGIATLPPFLGYLIRVYGEQVGLLVIGLLPFSLIVTGIFTPPGPKSHSDISPDAGEAHQLIEGTKNCDEETDSKGRSLSYWLSVFVYHPPFICLTLVSSIAIFEYTSWSLYLVPYGENLGVDSTRAVYLSTAGGIAGVFGKAFGLVTLRREKFLLPLGMIMPSLLLSVAYIISLFLEEFWVLLFVASLSGFCVSLTYSVCNAWIPNTVCVHHFKGAVSMEYFVLGVPTILAGLITGVSVDVTGNYRPAFAMLGMVSFVGAVMSVVWALFFETSHKGNGDDSDAKRG